VQANEERNDAGAPCVGFRDCDDLRRIAVLEATVNHLSPGDDPRSGVVARGRTAPDERYSIFEVNIVSAARTCDESHGPSRREKLIIHTW
jgi:hypothetical protein